ncbi:MAG: hypothetical protein OHK0029_24590 [Armatimonadaceae bacterium]
MERQQGSRKLLQVKGSTIGFARRLRLQATPSEKALWVRLRGRQVLGLKFRRQHPIGSYIVDFFCAEIALIIELDGPIHQQPDLRELDHARERVLEWHGLKILRFTNTMVLNDMETVINTILKVAAEHPGSNSPSPSPGDGEGAGG